MNTHTPYPTIQFPNDMLVTILRANGTTYRTLQSTSLLTTHGWGPNEVRVMQMNRTASN